MLSSQKSTKNVRKRESITWSAEGAGGETAIQLISDVNRRENCICHARRAHRGSMITRLIFCPFEQACRGGVKWKISLGKHKLSSKQFAAIVVSLLPYQLSERAVDAS